jgi:hypothetical protein
MSNKTKLSTASYEQMVMLYVNASDLKVLDLRTKYRELSN